MIRRGLVFVAMLVCFGCSESMTIIDDFPVAQPSIAESTEELVELLAVSYRDRNLDLFKSLLANDPGNRSDFLFILAPGSGIGGPWDYDEMVSIHQRLFEPEDTPAGQTPVLTEHWLISVNITLTPSIKFSERTDLYESAVNPTGLDPAKWKATDAVYTTDALFDLKSGNDLQVTGRANFVVIEDLTKEHGDGGKVLLLQWNDLGSGFSKSASVEESTWTDVLNLYN